MSEQNPLLSGCEARERGFGRFRKLRRGLLLKGLVVAFLGYLIFDYVGSSKPGLKFVREYYPAGFDSIALCEKHRYLVGVNASKNTATVLKIDGGEPINIFGKHMHSGIDDMHLNAPQGVVCDEGRGEILVSDTGNKRIQVYKIDDFSFVKTVSTEARLATLLLDTKHSRIFAIVLGEDGVPPGKSILPLDAASLQPMKDRSLFVKMSEGDAHEREMYAYDMAMDEKNDLLLVVDYGNARFDVFDLNKEGADGFVGVPSGFYDYGLRNAHPNKPRGIAVSNATGRIYISDDKEEHRIQIFQEKGLPMSFKERHIFAPDKLAVFEDKLFVVDQDEKTGRSHIDLYSP